MSKSKNLNIFKDLLKILYSTDHNINNNHTFFYFNLVFPHFNDKILAKWRKKYCSTTRVGATMVNLKYQTDFIKSLIKRILLNTNLSRIA